MQSKATQQPVQTNNGSFTVHYSQGDISEDVFFVLKCTLVPVGSTISFFCPQQGPEPPIDLPPTRVTDGKNFSAGVLCYVPAHFEGDITAKYAFSSPPPPGCKLELMAFIVIQPDDHRYTEAFTPDAFNLDLKRIPAETRFIQQEMQTD